LNGVRLIAQLVDHQHVPQQKENGEEQSVINFGCVVLYMLFGQLAQILAGETTGYEYIISGQMLIGF